MVQHLLFRTSENVQGSRTGRGASHRYVQEPLRVGELPTLLTFYMGAITFGMARAFGWAGMVRLCNPFRRGRHS